MYLHFINSYRTILGLRGTFGKNSSLITHKAAEDGSYFFSYDLGGANSKI